MTEASSRQAVAHPRSAFETAFVSGAHGDAEVQATLEAVDGACGELAA